MKIFLSIIIVIFFVGKCSINMELVDSKYTTKIHIESEEIKETIDSFNKLKEIKL